MPTTLKIINYPAASSGVSEDRNDMIMPPHPPLSREGRGNSVTSQQVGGIIRIQSGSWQSISGSLLINTGKLAYFQTVKQHKTWRQQGRGAR